jgi:membrane-associated phospholipid phosphatase
MRQAPWTALTLLGGTLLLCGRIEPAQADDFSLGDVLTDTRLYFTAPLRWDESDWLFLGGSVTAFAVAHSFDARVRDHFAPAGPAGVTGTDTNSTRDFLPTLSLVAGTWLVSEVTNDSFANTEAYTMVEAAGFSTVTAEALKYAAGRERPDQTTDPNNWRDSGSSFPSLHSTAAFAVGTVFAESGSDDYRWFRRVVGYGMAAATSYVRVRNNQHWLSDTVAGAALGIASGRFVTHRRLERAHAWNVSFTPSPEGGLMMTFSMILD